MALDQNGSASAAEKLKSLRIAPEHKAQKPSKGVAVVTFLIGVGIGFALSFAMPKPPADRSAQSPPVTTAPKSSSAQSSVTTSVTTTPKTVSQPGEVILTATGYVTPRRRIALSPQVMGQVVWVGIEKGDKVEKDQVLVRLDSQQYQARLAQAEARAASAKAHLEMMKAGTRPEEIAAARAEVSELEAMLTQADKTLERLKSSVDAGLETRQRLDEAQGTRDSAAGRLNAAKARLERHLAGERKEDIAAAEADYKSAMAAADEARIQMEDTIIKAPSAGTILEKLIEVGELVSPQNFGGSRGARTELLSLADLSDLQVEVDVNESDFEKIKPNGPARVTLDAYSKKSYEAYIREIAPEADRQKATIQVKVAITNADNLVRPEMGARVDFLAGGAETKVETAASNPTK